jgi:hypothetical protein
LLAVVAEGQISYYQDTGQGPSDPSITFEPDDENGIAFHGLPPGPWRIESSQDAPATVYLLRITNDFPMEEGAGDAYESLVNAAFRPMVHSFGADPGWDQAYLAESSLEPSASVSSTDPAFGCCNGVQVITVLEGELTITMDLPMQVIQMDNDPVSVGNSVVLGPGESALYESHMIASNSGATPARFLHGGVYKSGLVSGTPETLYGFFAGPRIATSFVHNPEDAMQSLNIDRATIEPGQFAPLTITDDDAFLLLTGDDAALTVSYPGGEEVPSLVGIEGFGALNSDGLDPGDYELENIGSSPVTIYILRVGPDLAPPVP